MLAGVFPSVGIVVKNLSVVNRVVLGSTKGMSNSFEDQFGRFRELWDSVSIVRGIPYSLFTFGDSELPYYLVVDGARPGDSVEVSQGVIKITRPMILTPYNMSPELKNFMEEQEWTGLFDFVMARTAAFSNLKMENQSRKSELTSDSLEEVLARLNTRLDDEDEDRVAVLSAPHGRGMLAVFKFATERIIESAADNLQELRERGFLPD